MQKRLWFDIGVLLLANVVTALFFVLGSTSVAQVLLTYFIQTVLIAVFYFKRIEDVNVSEVHKELPNSPLSVKVHHLISKNVTEEFLFVLLFLTPLAFLVFIFSYGLLGASPIELQTVDYPSVAIASAIFLLHHIGSYVIEKVEYQKGLTSVLHIPYKKLIVRVTTILAVCYIGLSGFSQTNDNTLFIAFIAAKTVVDIVCSGSLTLLRSNASKS